MDFRWKKKKRRQKQKKKRQKMILSKNLGINNIKISFCQKFCLTNHGHHYISKNLGLGETIVLSIIDAHPEKFNVNIVLRKQKTSAIGIHILISVIHHYLLMYGCRYMDISIIMGRAHWSSRRMFQATREPRMCEAGKVLERAQLETICS